jgi:NADH-quinone oxidoreductase subunit M
MLQPALNQNILLIFLLAPLAGAVFIMLFCPQENRNASRAIALLASLVMLFASLYAFFAYDSSGERFQFQIYADWIPTLHIGFHLGADGISLPMILLTGILSVASVLASFAIKERVKEYFVLLLLVIAGVAGTFVTLDLFFFLLFYELASIPMYFLIGIWGSDGQQASRTWVTKKEFSALKLILYLQLGGALILVGFLALYVAAPQAGLLHSTFDFLELLQGNFAKIPLFSRFVFPLLFVAFGIEAGLFPFHTWLPDGHSAAPTAVSMLLAGVLLKMGGYGMMRFACELLPHGASQWLNFFAVIAVVNILYGAWCALKQIDIKYIVAYSSVSHMGIVFLGMATQNIMGWSGALFQMFSHGIITALLFALAGLIYEKTHTRNILKHGGLAVKMPFVAVAFVLGGLASLGLPVFSGFVAEFLTFMGTYGFMHVLVYVGTFGLVLTALYILLAVRKIFFGPFNEAFAKLEEATHWWEQLHVSALVAVALFFGVAPSVILSQAQNSLSTVVHALIAMR